MYCIFMKQHLAIKMELYHIILYAVFAVLLGYYAGSYKVSDQNVDSVDSFHE